MKKKPRIMVLKLREIIYTLIFLALGIFLIVLLIHMFSGKARELSVHRFEIRSGRIYICASAWQPSCRCGSGRG